ncbi:MAG: glycoside hydrolase family 10 protein [Fidelibacterota bacterium]
MTTAEKATKWVAFFLFLVLGGVRGQAQDALSFRGLWVVRSSMTSRESIDAALDFAKSNHFNHVFVQVRGRGDSYYDSRIVPKAKPVRNTPFDPLRYAVRTGHELGLKVHAWLNVYYVWSSDVPPEDPRHVVLRHPEWLDRPAPGHAPSSRSRFLSPNHPEVAVYLLAVFEEVLTEYGIDGLHLDYFRYRDADMGYHDFARWDFERRIGIDPVMLLNKNNPGSNPVSQKEREPLSLRWDQHRRDAITSLLEQCNALILEEKPGCVLSVAVKPDPDQARSRFFQEWDRWLVQGLVDYVIPMNYDPDLRTFAWTIDRIYGSIPPRYRPGIIMGIAVYNQDALDARDKIRYTRITGLRGISIFSYDAQKENPDFFIPIREEMLR